MHFGYKEQDRFISCLLLLYWEYYAGYSFTEFSEKLNMVISLKRCSEKNPKFT